MKSRQDLIPADASRRDEGHKAIVQQHTGKVDGEPDWHWPLIFRVSKGKIVSAYTRELADAKLVAAAVNRRAAKQAEGSGE